MMSTNRSIQNVPTNLIEFVKSTARMQTLEANIELFSTVYGCNFDCYYEKIGNEFKLLMLIPHRVTVINDQWSDRYQEWVKNEEDLSFTEIDEEAKDLLIDDICSKLIDADVECGNVAIYVEY